MGPGKLKLNEEQGKHTDLAQHKCFGPAFLQSVLRLVKAQHRLQLPEKSVINMIGLLLPISDWPII
jgi:hypothetical protein